MLNNDNYNMPDAFESLLLDTIIDDYENNIEIQKSIDMTTHYIQNADFSIAISDSKESNFFKKVLSQSSKSFFNSKFWFLLFIAIILTLAGILIFNFLPNNHSQQNVVLPKTDSINVSRHNQLDTVDKIPLKDAEFICSVRKIKIDGRFQLVQVSRQNNIIAPKQKTYPPGSFSYTRSALLPFDTTFANVLNKDKEDDVKIVTKIQILGRNLPKMDYSMIKEEFKSKDDGENWYEADIPGFNFIPMGSYNNNGKTVSVQAAWAQETEVTNFQWMLFLNDLIDHGRDEDLQECIPNDEHWADKMSLEDDSLQANWKSVKNKSSLVTFPRKFVRKNNINDIELPSFAVKPIVGISHKAAMIYAQWLSEKYGFEKLAFRLPTAIEWQWMARGGKKDPNLAFVWGGPYTRSSYGAFMANFLVSDLYYDLDSNEVGDLDLYYANKYANKQNLEHTPDEVLELKTDFMPIRFTVVAHFAPNDYGLYDMCGNAAEMLNDPTLTKGGSWASPAYYIRIDKEENWDGKPSDCVGFRLVRTYLGK